MKHLLKTWPVFFNAIRDGRKTFEVRLDDRMFTVGDVLILRKWEPNQENWANPREQEIRKVTYILRDTDFPGIASGYVVMALAKEAT